MAATRYTVSAAADFAAKDYANLAAAKREADKRAAATGAPVIVTTQATGRLSYTAVAEPVVIADQAEVEKALAAEERAEALAGVAGALAALVAKGAARAEAAPQGPVKKAPAKGRRAALGASVVDGWELLYDKPKQAAQVGRNAEGKYALICTTHRHAHPLNRLVQERGLRGGHRSVWCPSCGA